MLEMSSIFIRLIMECGALSNVPGLLRMVLQAPQNALVKYLFILIGAEDTKDWGRAKVEAMQLVVLYLSVHHDMYYWVHTSKTVRELCGYERVSLFW